MLALCLVLLHVYGRLSRHASGFRPSPQGLPGRGRSTSVGYAVLRPGCWCQFRVAPYGAHADAVWVSLLPFFQPVTVAAFKLISLNNYRTVLASGQMELLVNTLLVAVATATVAITLTFLGAWLAVRRGPAAGIIERLATIPLVFRAHSRHRGDAGVPAHSDPALWHARILIWAFIINYLPYGMRYCSSGMLQIHRELEEAAAICRRVALTRLRRIGRPLLARRWSPAGCSSS